MSETKTPLPLWTDKEMMNEILSLRYRLEEANAKLAEHERQKGKQ